jgi:hypothetical protein
MHDLIRLDRCRRSVAALTALSVLLASVQASSSPLQEVADTGPARSDPARRAPELIDVLLTGRVVDASAIPSARAVVVTSAGGQAITADDGSFQLQVGIPAGATSVRVTAIASAGRGTSTASLQVPISAIGGTIATGTLMLQPSASCEPEWLPTFGGQPGTNSNVQALAVYDDGHGPALYVGGVFTAAGDSAASFIARWNGARWSAVGTGIDDWVFALAVYDDGSGPALYAGGHRVTASGFIANNIARWDGSNWSALGSGTNDDVDALAVYDDGSGPALYAGGYFTSADGVAANHIAKWNGSSWSQLGSGVNGVVEALTAFDDGGGAALYAGGKFALAGGLAANHIAKWNGSSWSALGSGTDDEVRSLAVFDDGSGAALYTGGTFTTAGGVAANSIAEWNGSSWSALGGGIGPRNALTSVQTLTVFDDGGGAALYAGGNFATASGVVANSVAKWNGSSWSSLGSGMNNIVEALTVFDDGSGPALFAAGVFWTAGGVDVNRNAKWNGSSWSVLGQGLNSGVGALAVFDDGGGPALYAGGAFAAAGGVAMNHIAKWNGSTWSALGSGIGGQFVDALAAYDDGSGPALYAGGSFTNAGGAAASSIAKWKGSSWSPLGSGMNGPVQSLKVFDDGSGTALYAGGAFTVAGGVAASSIAKWNGSIWSPLAGGMNGSVHALGVFDDGSGTALYAGGGFTVAGGVAANRIARWDGSSWSPLGSGMNTNTVDVLNVFDDGSGPALYAGGAFAGVDDSNDSFLGKWGNPAGCGSPGISFCDPGVGSVIACPCGNAPSSAGLGCNNSSNTGGAELSSTGIARLSYDTLRFTTHGEKPTALSTFSQGTAVLGTGLVFGQGVRCVSVNLKRLYTKPASGGSATAPIGNELSVHARSAALGDVIAPGTSRYYYVYYRDPVVLGGCSSASTFNSTQSLSVIWAP